MEFHCFIFTLVNNFCMKSYIKHLLNHKHCKIKFYNIKVMVYERSSLRSNNRLYKYLSAKQTLIK